MRFNPNATLPEALDTEQERVIFIKAAVLSLLQNARIKLNPKKLYQVNFEGVKRSKFTETFKKSMFNLFLKIRERLIFPEGILETRVILCF